MNKPLIEIKSVTKKFKKKTANKDISFDIKKGEKIGIIGANGSGKTTLVEQIIGISKPTKGKIKYNFDFISTPQEKMGMQFQDSSYPDGLNVKDIIDFSLDIYRSNVDEKELEILLNTFQMKEFFKSPVKGLSGGQQQKLNVLLALVHKPNVVILDEISTGLDIAAKTEILNFIEEYITDENVTSIIISHNMNEVTRLCTRLIVMKDGVMINDTTPKDIIKKYKTIDNYMDELLGVTHDN